MKCAACDAELIYHEHYEGCPGYGEGVDGYWFHKGSGLRGWVDDPTGMDAAHIAIPVES